MSKTKHKFISAVHLILKQDNKILLSRRYKTGYEDGNYSVVAGHIDASETARQAMIREAKEEAGLEIDMLDLETIHVMHRMGKDQERIDFFMRANKWQGEPKILETHKCDDLSWFNVDDLPDNIVPYIKAALEFIKNNEFYSEFGW